jgi:hypothetical protein
MDCKRMSSPTIDDVFTAYMINFHKITREKGLIGTVVAFCILLREFLNNVGFDYIKKFSEHNVNMDYKFTGSFCSINSPELIPDYINEFIEVFVNVDSFFNIEKKLLLCISENFCNWLFVNDFTNLKLSLNNSD